MGNCLVAATRDAGRTDNSFAIHSSPSLPCKASAEQQQLPSCGLGGNPHDGGGVGSTHAAGPHDGRMMMSGSGMKLAGRTKGPTTTSGMVNLKTAGRNQSILTGTAKMGGGQRLEEEWKMRGTVLGYGRLATVREGIHKESGKVVAIKACSKKLLAARPARISRTSEIDALQKVWTGLPVCPHIVELLATYEDKQHVYLVTELARGGDLFHSLAAREVFLERDAAHIVQQLLSAVSHCHDRGVVHRDIKPENILVSTQDLDVKLVDFGSAAIVETREQVLSDFMGTAFYAAPEVWLHEYSSQADMWSVGALLFVLLTGLPPSGLNRSNVASDATWRQLQAGVAPHLPQSASDEVRDFLSKLLEPNPSLRLTAKQALQHPWISGGSATAHAGPNLEESIRNLRSYTAINKFQKAAITLISVLLTEKELRMVANKLRSDFKKDGRMTQADLEKALQDLALAKVCHQIQELRGSMLMGLPSRESSAVVFAMDDFLELVLCRMMAHKALHVSQRARLTRQKWRPKSPGDDDRASPSWKMRLTKSPLEKVFSKGSRTVSLGNLQALGEESDPGPLSPAFGEEESLKALSDIKSKKSKRSPGKEISLTVKTERANQSVHGDMIYAKLAQSQLGASFNYDVVFDRA